MNRHIAAGLLAVSCAFLAACSSAASGAPGSPSASAAASAAASPPATAACEAQLKQLAGHLGNVGADPGQFQAAVNALAYGGELPAACAHLTRAQVMKLAAQAAGGS